MKLDPTVMRTMSGQDFGVLEAVEKGMQKHALVPAPLIASLSHLRHGGTGKIIGSLLRDKLLSHDKSCGYDGYRLTNAGYDILALQNLKSRKFIAAMGDRIGTGKESDIYLAVHPNGQQVVLKIHRLGRTSFRNVKKTRDYFVYHQTGRSGNANPPTISDSWLFLSRKSALKEYAFMKALYDVDYPTPVPLAHNRHIVCMSLIRGVPLYQVRSQNLSPDQAESIFHQAANLAVRLAKHGLVHCDLNEFNLLIDMSGIQQTAMSQEHDPYVRHSGMSVAAESAPGMLSARGPWEPEYLQPLQQEDVGSHHEEDLPPKPVELLESGEPKPIVTLIDFPQMVSTQHPNAKELYERDTACLYKFFSHKLQFRIPEAELEQLHLSWESIQEILASEAIEAAAAAAAALVAAAAAAGDDDDDDDATTATAAAGTVAGDTQSVCLANKAQLRLDQELKASGYSKNDANRDMELYYYYNQETKKEEDLVEEEEEEDNDNDEEAEAEAEQEEGSPNTEEDAHDDDSIDSHEQDKDRLDVDNSTVVSTRSNLLLPPGQLASLDRAQLQEQARLRVQQQLEAQKKKNRTRGAFRKSNSNKTYVKGKRVFQDVEIR